MKDNKAPGWLSDFGQAAEMEKRTEQRFRKPQTLAPACPSSLELSLFPVRARWGSHLQNGAPDLMVLAGGVSSSVAWAGRGQSWAGAGLLAEEWQRLAHGGGPALLTRRSLFSASQGLSPSFVTPSPAPHQT